MYPKFMLVGNGYWEYGILKASLNGTDVVNVEQWTKN